MEILKHIRELILSESVDDLIKVADEEKAKLRDVNPIEDPELFGLKRDSSAELFFPVQNSTRHYEENCFLQGTSKSVLLIYHGQRMGGLGAVAPLLFIDNVLRTHYSTLYILALLSVHSRYF